MFKYLFGLFVLYQSLFTDLTSQWSNITSEDILKAVSFIVKQIIEELMDISGVVPTPLPLKVKERGGNGVNGKNQDDEIASGDKMEADYNTKVQPQVSVKIAKSTSEDENEVSSNVKDSESFLKQNKLWPDFIPIYQLLTTTLEREVLLGQLKMLRVQRSYYESDQGISQGNIF